MSTELKAARLLSKLYFIRKMLFMDYKVEDILSKATSEEIDFYYKWLCK